MQHLLIWEKRSPLQFILPAPGLRGLSRGSVFGKRVSSWCLVVGCMCHFGLAAISRTSCGEATGGEAGNACLWVGACVSVCAWDRKEAMDKNVTEWIIRALATTTKNPGLKAKAYLLEGSCRETWGQGLSGAWCVGSPVMSHSGSSLEAVRVWSWWGEGGVNGWDDVGVGVGGVSIWRAAESNSFPNG